MLKFVAIFASILVFAQLRDIQPTYASNWVENNITEFIESIRRAVPNPLVLDDFETQFHFGDDSSFTFGYSNASFNRTTDFELRKVEFDMQNFTGHVEFYFPEIASNFRVYTALNINGRKLETNETRYARIRDFNIHYNFEIFNHTISKRRYEIRMSRVSATVGSIEYNLDGTIFGVRVGDEFTRWVNEHSAEYINNNQDYVSEILTVSTEGIISFILGYFPYY